MEVPGLITFSILFFQTQKAVSRLTGTVNKFQWQVTGRRMTRGSAIMAQIHCENQQNTGKSIRVC